MRVFGSLRWGPWLDLNGAHRNSLVPKHIGGLYRIRARHTDRLEYVGQTGRLRSRMGHLQGAFGCEMPYRDPHTAAPALWALLHQNPSLRLEVSICPVEGDRAWRKGLEAVAIALYRQECEASPCLNFGRMPLGYRMSSANNRRLVEAGKRFRGGPSSETDTSHLPSQSPMATLRGVPVSDDWCGHAWSPWVAFPESRRLHQNAVGLYRIRALGSEALLYIGEGRIRSRLQAHWKKMSQPQHAQGEVFRQAKGLEFSWTEVANSLKHHLLELENDLIASHLLEAEEVPKAQFIG